MKYIDSVRLFKKASARAISDTELIYDPAELKVVSEMPVTDKRYKIKPEAIKLLKKLVKDVYKDGVANEWIQKAEKPRKLYLHGVSRIRYAGEEPDEHPEFYLDIRDKNDPDYRYDADAGHAISWDEGSKGLSYDG